MRIGYACINLELREKDVYSTRAMILKTINAECEDCSECCEVVSDFTTDPTMDNTDPTIDNTYLPTDITTTHGIKHARELALANIADLQTQILHNESLGLRFFRITSNLIPHLGNPRVSSVHTIDFALKALARTGKTALSLGHRITMHPGQYVQLGSNKPEVVAQSVIELTSHADIFKAMGLLPTHGSVMIIHGGGVYGDKPAALKRWGDAFKLLPRDVSRYIVLENDEFSYSVMDLLPLCEENGIPLCIDFFHHSVKHYKEFDIYDPALLSRVLNTWKLRGIKPKCHLSQQRPNARPGTHDDCVDNIPQRLLQLADSQCMDIMLEVKHKDQCVAQILKKQFKKITLYHNDKPRIEWKPII
tara:strand:+ start:798 stop:1880 length:1083 start_codon:yes stop_codon:yes gene_type:complete